jgi:hypothetical protein
VLPFTALGFHEAGGSTEISITHGRLTFHLPADARVRILTPSTRLDPVRDRAMAGEVFVGGGGLMGLKMTQGSLQVRSLTDASRPIVASLEPVFLPKRPAIAAALFSTDPIPPVPPNARGVFDPSGQSIGYLGSDGKLVIHPGYTNDLTGPFSPKLVQLAMATIPEKERNDEAMPLFDVNGAYVGYLSGPVFYAQAAQPATPEAPAAAPARRLSRGAIGAIGAGSVAALGAGIAAGVGALAAKPPKCPPKSSPAKPGKKCP